MDQKSLPWFFQLQPEPGCLPAPGHGLTAHSTDPKASKRFFFLCLPRALNTPSEGRARPRRCRSARAGAAWGQRFWGQPFPVSPHCLGGSWSPGAGRVQLCLDETGAFQGFLETPGLWKGGGSPRAWGPGASPAAAAPRPCGKVGGGGRPGRVLALGLRGHSGPGCRSLKARPGVRASVPGAPLPRCPRCERWARRLGPELGEAPLRGAAGGWRGVGSGGAGRGGF